VYAKADAKNLSEKVCTFCARLGYQIQKFVLKYFEKFADI